ncbi:hypothetical protein GGR52DRAFT_575426 [Hypoxylon sp. FL1284]|nr:hypothetical protein GGR52DRAFT_575426 [Hypoxylon sp. FL1284]
MSAGGIIASNIYRSDDALLYHSGNRQLLAPPLPHSAVLWPQEQASQQQVNAMTADEKLTYWSTSDEGSKRSEFEHT